MPSQMLSGRISAKKRSFEEVVSDVRHAVYAVTRHRARAQGGFEGVALGSGFFVSPRAFLTCAHVVMGPTSPHLDGDRYQLVNELGGGGTIHNFPNTIRGQNLHVFPNVDLALLVSDTDRGWAYLPLEYGDVRIGREIGVAGYPLPALMVVDDVLRYDGLVFRVAKSVLGATYETNIAMGEGLSLDHVPVLEVNFLFVPGNSGGPIFAADTGRVLGFVHGYRTQKIRETVESVTLATQLPQGVSNIYVDSLSALYSVGIKLSRVRTHLEQFGVAI